MLRLLVRIYFVLDLILLFGVLKMLDSFKKRFLESVNKSDMQVFTEDLRNMILSAESDDEITAVIQALKKY